MTTLAALERVVRAKPIERDLCCPACWCDVELRDGFYWCAGGCGFVTGRLAALDAAPCDGPRVSPLGYEPEPEDVE